MISTEEARDLAQLYAPEIAEKHLQQMEAYKRMPDNVLFRVQKVEVNIGEYDMPGPTRHKVSCVRCGQVVRDGREVTRKGNPLCLPCAGGAYFSKVREITCPEISLAPEERYRASSNVEPAEIESIYNFQLN
ncbi:hypothetical protein ACFLZM_06420 [Thermodesulfobacteriota bacterium]